MKLQDDTPKHSTCPKMAPESSLSASLRNVPQNSQILAFLRGFLETLMCLKHNKYHIQMRFCNVQGTPKIIRQNSKKSFQNRLKIHSKSLPEAIQNSPQKKHATKTPKNRKKCRKWSPKGYAKSDKLNLKIRKRELRLRICRTPNHEAQNASSRLQRYGLVGSRRDV